MDIQKVIEKYNKGKSELFTFRGLMTEIYTYCIPSRNSWVNQNQGAENTQIIYNSHPVLATKHFASNILSLMMPAGLKFFNLQSNKILSQDDQEAFNKEVAPISDIIFEYIERSNYFIACHEAFIDLAAGMGGVICKYSGDNDNPLAFTSLDMSKLAVYESSNGVLNNVFQDVDSIDYDDAKYLYPDATFNEECKTLNLIVCTVYDEDEKKYHYMIIDKGNHNIYLDRTYACNPFSVFRWTKLSTEMRGRGILADMISDIKTANLMMEDILTASQRVIAPPTIVYSGSLINPSNIDFSPNSIITVKQQQGITNPITSLPFTGNLPFGIQQVQAFNQQLDEAMLINPLGGVGQGIQTATEVSSRMQLAANVLGSAEGRLQRELLEPMINKSIEILTTLGLIPKLPKGIKISYQSSVTNMQKQSNFTKLMQSIQAIAQISGSNANQAIMTSLDVSRLPTYIAEQLGADLSLFRTTAEVTQSMKMQQQIAMNQIKQQQTFNNQNTSLAGAPINTNLPGISQ
jgi:hypothetical protein